MEGQCARLPWPGTCGTCRKQGHLRQECPENKTEATSYYQEQTSKLEQVSTSDYYDDDKDSDGCEAVAFAFVKEAVTPEANTLNKHLPRPISDSGASHGITCDTNIVSNVQTNTSRVKHVGGHTTPANTATATWEVSTPGGAHSLTFPSCFYDEELGNQIISEGQATSQVYHIYKFGNLCTYSKGGTVVAICHKTNNLYPFDMATDEPCQLCLRPDIALELAHHRKAARIMNSISKNSTSALEKNNLEPSENRELQKYFEPQQPRTTLPSKPLTSTFSLLRGSSQQAQGRPTCHMAFTPRSSALSGCMQNPQHPVQLRRCPPLHLLLQGQNAHATSQESSPGTSTRTSPLDLDRRLRTHRRANTWRLSVLPRHCGRL